jgi:O-antigen ligase
MDLLILLFLVIALVATGSASGIIGAFVALVVALFLGWRMRVNVLRSTVVFFAFMLLVALVWLLNFEVQVFVEKFMIYKLDTDSGVERLRSVAASWQIFESTPIFGGGWGSVTSDDLVVRLMSNVGLVGTSVFLLMLLVIHRALWRVFVNRLVRRDSRIIMLGAVWVTFVAYWFVVEIAGWSYQFQVSFLVLGLAMSAAHLARHYVATKEENIPAIISHISPELLKISSSG